MKSIELFNVHTAAFRHMLCNLMNPVLKLKPIYQRSMANPAARKSSSNIMKEIRMKYIHTFWLSQQSVTDQNAGASNIRLAADHYRPYGMLVGIEHIQLYLFTDTIDSEVKKYQMFSMVSTEMCEMERMRENERSHKCSRNNHIFCPKRMGYACAIFRWTISKRMHYTVRP